VTQPLDLSKLSIVQKDALILELMAQVSSMSRLVADLREEVARLKGLNRRPPIKPSGMADADPAKPDNERVRPGRGKVIPQVTVED
jgi:hypothetical protein